MADSTTTADYPGGDLEAASELAANKAYADAVTRLNAQRLNTLQGAGYQGNIDPTTGAMTKVRVDPNNPYGTYQSLLRSSAMEGEQLHNQAAGRGIGGGLAQQGDRQAAYDYGAGANTLGTGLQQQLGGYDQAQLGAANDRTSSITNARQNAANSALQYQLQNALLALPGNIAAQLAGSPGGQGPTQGSGAGAPSTPIDAGLVGSYGQGPGYKPTAPTGGGQYTAGGGSIYYQSNKGTYGKKPLV